jgi:hypothetical protein
MRARLVPQMELERDQRQRMADLLERHFLGVTVAAFDRDLREKNWVLLLEERGDLLGFSTLLVYQTTVAAETVTVLYSGDTIVAPEAWSRSSLSRAWIGAVQTLRARYPEGRLWWLLIASGFRTYRFLPVYWQVFYPRHDAPTPPDVQRLLSDLATERFGERYVAQGGIVRLAAPQTLRGDLARVPEGRRADPHVAFFLERNPGWHRGDELVCLTELAEHNLTAAGERMWRSAVRLRANEI